MRVLSVVAVFVVTSVGLTQEMPKNLRGLLSVSRVWQISGGELVDTKPTITKAPGGKGTIAFGPDGRRYVIGAASHEVDPYYLAEGESVLLYTVHSKISSFVVDKDEHLETKVLHPQIVQITGRKQGMVCFTVILEDGTVLDPHFIFLYQRQIKYAPPAR